MTTVVLLDSGPLGLISNPKGLEQSVACTNWMRTLLSRGVRVILPEIADYEVRRELIRANKRRGIQRLDDLKTVLEYAPITTQVMLQAAEFWALARQQGTPTAPDVALDGDAVMAAQATIVSRAGDTAIVATMNVQHPTRLVEAYHRTDIE